MKKQRKLTIPKSKSESQDQQWHQRHKRGLESAILRRMKEGTAFGFQEAVGRAKLRPVTIRLATGDIERARELATRKGIGYQTYIKMLLREALERESGGR